MAVPGFQPLSPSRKRLRAGDVFVMQLPGGDYLFGRVINTDARWTSGPIEKVGTQNLVYVFRFRSPVKEVPARRELRPDRLLIAPELVNRLGWSRGYFETIGNIPLEVDEVLPVHCFEYGITYPQWYDEHFNELPGPIAPVGAGGAGNWRTVEWRVFDALGLEQPPE